jgi:putative resolvase
MPTETERLLSIGATAALLGVSVDTVRRWTAAGRLTAIRTAGNQRRYRLSDVLTLRDAA